jgi:Rod binding domain-containing protein
MLDIASLRPTSAQLPGNTAGGLPTAAAADRARQLQDKKKEDPALRKAFDSFVGETFFGQMLSSMRKTVGKPAYFYGGRAEEIFRGQLDQELAAEMTKASANTFTGPMFDLFMLNRK